MLFRYAEFFVHVHAIPTIQMPAKARSAGPVTIKSALRRKARGIRGDTTSQMKKPSPARTGVKRADVLRKHEAQARASMIVMAKLKSAVLPFAELPHPAAKELHPPHAAPNSRSRLLFTLSVVCLRFLYSLQPNLTLWRLGSTSIERRLGPRGLGLAEAIRILNARFIESWGADGFAGEPGRREGG